MSVHNHTASIVALARVKLADIDFAKPTYEIPCDQLRLLLETLIDLGSPEHNTRVAEAGARTVTTLMDSFAAMRDKNG